MLGSRLRWIIAAVVLSAAPSAGAPLAYQGTLTLEFITLSVDVAGTGVATVNGASPPGGPVVGLALTGNAFSTTALIIDITDPAASPIEGQQLTVSAPSGSFSGSPLGGMLALTGMLKVCLFMDCTSPAVPANLSFPLGVVGVGGATTATAFVNTTVTGAPWTTATVSLLPFPTTITAMGFVHGPVSATSSAATVGGAVGLVSPVFLQTNAGPFPGEPFPGVARLTLTFVPEPATALLLGAGVGALALRARRGTTRA